MSVREGMVTLFIEKRGGMVGVDIKESWSMSCLEG